MRKYLFYTLVMMLTLGFISCDKQEEVTSIENSVFKDVDLLKSDGRFTGLIKKNIEIAANFAAIEDNNHLTSCPDDASFEGLALALKFNTLKDFEDFSEGQYATLRALSLDYDFESIKEAQMVDLMLDVIETLDIKSDDKNEESSILNTLSLAEKGTAAVNIQLGCSTSVFSSNAGGLTCQTSAIISQAEAF